MEVGDGLRAGRLEPVGDDEDAPGDERPPSWSAQPASDRGAPVGLGGGGGLLDVGGHVGEQRPTADPTRTADRRRCGRGDDAPAGQVLELVDLGGGSVAGMDAGGHGRGAIGCSDLASTAAARRSSVPASVPSATAVATSSMRPSVRVPVLSTTATSTRRVCSRTSPPLMMMPSWAPRPVPTMIAVGVARPRAQGQAMISTATAAVKASSTRVAGERATRRAWRGRWPARSGTKMPATRSARRWTGAATLGLLDEADDLGERGVGADAGGLDHEVAVGVDGGADDLVAGTDLDGHGLAGEHRDVDGGVALDDDAVGGDLLAGAHRRSARRPRATSTRDLGAVDEGAVWAPRSASARRASPERRLARASNHLPSRMSVMITPAVSK